MTTQRRRFFNGLTAVSIRFAANWVIFRHKFYLFAKTKGEVMLEIFIAFQHFCKYWKNFKCFSIIDFEVCISTRHPA